MFLPIDKLKKNTVALLTGIGILEKLTPQKGASVSGTSVFIDYVDESGMSEGDRTILQLMGWRHSKLAGVHTWSFTIDG